jgi:hypothetical protein
MHFEVTVIGIGLPGKQTLQFAPRGIRAQLFEGRLGIGDDRVVALGLAKLD